MEVLNQIYETDFLGFSDGFRPGRSQHQALDALCCGLDGRQVNWVLDLDVRSFFDMLSHEWLVRFLQHRIVAGKAATVTTAVRMLRARVVRLQSMRTHQRQARMTFDCRALSK